MTESDFEREHDEFMAWREQFADALDEQLREWDGTMDIYAPRGPTCVADGEAVPHHACSSRTDVAACHGCRAWREVLEFLWERRFVFAFHPRS
ncbi:MAG: hypothetical protein F4Y11_09515 [Chloroflexi bacterium]|nr:hypothetical protein [Chloroflexota bacterium]